MRKQLDLEFSQGGYEKKMFMCLFWNEELSV